MNRTEMEKESRMAFITDAARRLFGEKGIENTTMDDIAAASDYTRRTLYAYFKSFDEICLSVLLEDQAVRWELQKKAVAAADSGLAKLRAWGQSLYRFVRDNPQYVRLEVYWDFHGINPKLIDRKLFRRFKRQNDDLAEGLRGIFRHGIGDGPMRDDLHVDMCISQFLYSFRSVINRAISPGYSFAAFDADEYVNHYLDLFGRGIGGRRKENK
jgi:AcrR family transcriptional regulator